MSLERVLLGVDLGGSSLKAAVVDTDCRVLGSSEMQINTLRRRPDWAEQEPHEWYAALVRAVPRALAAAGVKPTQLAGMAISAGAHIGVLTGAAGVALRPAILWSDQRAAAEAEFIEQRMGAVCRRHSLNRPQATWLLPQLLWLRKHEPQVMERLQRLYLAKDWLRSRLTGDWHTDMGDAVGALLADVPGERWSAELLALAGLLPAQVPALSNPLSVVGEVSTEAARECGLPAGLPVVCGSIDTTVESCAAGACLPGEGVVKLASAGVLYLVTAQAEVMPPVSCYPHLIDGRYYAATGTNTCAAAHRWLRDLCFSAETIDAPGEAWRMMDRLAELVAPGADGLLFHPYLQGERAPLWDPRVRGDYLGLTLRHNRGHMVRALYEGIAFGLRHAMDAARGRGFEFGALKLIGGGSRSRLWGSILASVLDKRLVVPAFGDAAVASALVAGSGVGVLPPPSEWVRYLPGPTDLLDPIPAWRNQYARRYLIWLDAGERLREIYHRLSALSPGEPRP
jgi:xylulokinase